MRFPILSAALLCLAASAEAAVIQTPQTTGVAIERAASVNAVYVSDDGAPFTVREGRFCSALIDARTGRDIASGEALTGRAVACAPGATFGRLARPEAQGAAAPPPDAELCGGEACAPVVRRGAADPDALTRFTDRIGVSAGTARRGAKAMRASGRGEFYALRRFIPVGLGDLGAGPGAPVEIAIALRPQGALSAPLTITRSELFGLDDPEGAREYLLRLGADALAQGRVFAQLDTVGRGVISGWWAVRGPGEPALSDSDLLAPRQLDAAGRAERTVLRRIARFRARADARGRLVVEGPLYRDLPVLGPGRHDLVFQLDEAFRGDAAVPIRPLAYYPVPQIPAPALNARIERLTGGAARISWIPQGDERALIARVEIRGERSAIAPYANGVMDLPAGWLPPGSAVRLSLLTPEGGVLASIDIAQ